jgi:hypothetical protein
MGMTKKAIDRHRARIRRNERLRERADEVYGSDKIHIDHGVSPDPDNGGYWVEAWVWVPKKEDNET